MFKTTLLELHRVFKDFELPVRIVLLLHDGIWFICPAGSATVARVGETIEKIMENSAKVSVRSKVELNYGHSGLRHPAISVETKAAKKDGTPKATLSRAATDKVLVWAHGYLIRSVFLERSSASVFPLARYYQAVFGSLIRVTHRKMVKQFTVSDRKDGPRNGRKNSAPI